MPFLKIMDKVEFHYKNYLDNSFGLKKQTNLEVI